MATKITGPTVVVDGHNAFIRNYVRSPYTDANGERKGGTTGMVISVRKLINDFGASNLLVVWDGEGGSQRRRSIFSEYKAGRTVRLNQREGEDFDEDAEARLENMRQQRDLAQEYLAILGVPQVRIPGVEADDVMAFVAAKMDHPNGCIVVTTDQDLLQLIRAGSQDASEVRVYSPIKKTMYDRPTFISEYGILPENYRLMKALTGDASDNIEGVKGFGIKTVVKSFPFLAERRATADDVLEAWAGLKGVLGKRLEEGKSRFLENLQLVDLSEPMLSATASRQAREALHRDIGCKEVDFRVRLVRDAISFGGDGFTAPFREFVMRRRRLLAEIKPGTQDEDTTDAVQHELKDEGVEGNE